MFFTKNPSQTLSGKMHITPRPSMARAPTSSNGLAMASNLLAMATNLRAMANLLAMASKLAMASNLLAMASNHYMVPQPNTMASNLLAMASNLRPSSNGLQPTIPMASKLLATVSNILATASNLLAMFLFKLPCLNDSQSVISRLPIRPLIRPSSRSSAGSVGSMSTVPPLPSTETTSWPSALRWTAIWRPRCEQNPLTSKNGLTNAERFKGPKKELTSKSFIGHLEVQISIRPSSLKCPKVAAQMKRIFGSLQCICSHDKTMIEKPQFCNNISLKNERNHGQSITQDLLNLFLH